MIDAWIQHPTARHSGDPMFDSLRRWTKSDLDAVPTIADTVAALDAAGVSTALTSAWCGPNSVMISNDEVASFVAESGGRLVGVGSADIRKPMEAVRDPALCGGAWLQGDSHLAVDVVSAAHRQAFLPGLCGVLRNGCAVLYPNRSYRTANAVGSRQAYLSRSGGAGVPGTDHRRGAHWLPVDR